MYSSDYVYKGFQKGGTTQNQSMWQKSNKLNIKQKPARYAAHCI